MGRALCPSHFLIPQRKVIRMQAPAKGTKRRSISYAKWGYIFIAPFFIAFAIFQLIPLASTIYYSFFEYYRSGLKVIGPNFTGLSNYVKLLSLDLPKYLGNTMLLWILGFVPQITISLLLAVWFTDNRLRIRCQPFFKTVIYMPNLIMASAFAMLFFALFSDNGPVNAALISAGILNEPFRFLSSVAGTRGLIALMNFLMWFGNTTILLMAAVMGIDLSLFEAAEIDGAGEVTKFFKIAIPLISPTLFYLFCTGFIGNLQAYVDSQVFANGHPGAQTIVYFIWNYGISRSRYGIASAASVVLTISIMIITLLQFKISEKWVYSE